MLWFGFDHDDPALKENLAAAGAARWSVHQPRMGLAAWTNFLAGEIENTCLASNPDHEDGDACDTPYLASIGDDMVPVTPGWDRMLIEAQEKIGGGFSYPNDRRRADIPEACVIDARIVRALGWMCQPTLGHWFVDAVWRDLGQAVNRLIYRGDVIVEHRPPNVAGSGAAPDATYAEAAAGFAADMAAYQKWRLKGLRSDVETVRACLANETA